MASEAVTARVAGNGRLSLPVKQRRLLGLETGGVVVLRVEAGELRIKPVMSLVKEIQALASSYSDKSRSNVDALLAERRKEAAEED